jgi:adenylosuccinate synthase
MTDVTVVVGGQYGSEGKGAVVAFLARGAGESTTVIRVAGPNAGHTAYDPQGREWKLRAVPVAAVTSRTCQLHIGAGSEIDPTVLADEVTRLDEAGHDVSSRLTIHPAATILLPSDIAEEATSGIVGRIGSTGKGIGAARAARIMRTAPTAGELFKHRPSTLSEDGPFDLGGVQHVIVEGTQGYGLGLHTRQYPQVTSSDCRAIDFLGMAGISPWSVDVDRLRVLIVARMYPIRVAGNSGPLKDETSWSQLGLPEEHTTVTNKVRRVGEWDDELLHEAIAANGGGNWNSDVQLAITMVDQRFPQIRDVINPGRITDHAYEWLQNAQDEAETDIALIGTGPNSMMEVSL